MLWQPAAEPVRSRDALQSVIAIGLTDGEIAAAADVHARTVRRWRQASGPGDVRTSSLDDLRALVEFLLLRQQPGETVATWLRARSPALDHQRPLDLIGRGELERVIDAAESQLLVDPSPGGETFVAIEAPTTAALGEDRRSHTSGHPAPSSPASAVFVSYVREDSERVDRICAQLQEAGLPLWRDIDNLVPGTRWRQEIRRAIRTGSAFVGLFSSHSERRGSSYMRAEIIEAIDELRVRSRDRPWFIPVRLNACELPTIEIGAGELLSDLHYLDLFDSDDKAAIARLIAAVEAALGR